MREEWKQQHEKYANFHINRTHAKARDGQNFLYRVPAETQSTFSAVAPSAFRIRAERQQLSSDRSQSRSNRTKKRTQILTFVALAS